MQRPLAIVVVLVIWGKAATAQDTTATALVTEARVHLHANPSDASGVIKTLPTGTALQLLKPGALRSDFFRVATNTGDTGWVAFAFVRPAGEPFTSSTTSTNIETQPEGEPGGDWRTNLRKNRIDAPAVSHTITWEALADTVILPFARGGLPKKRSGWRDEEALDVGRFEGIPVTVTGYLVKIKPQVATKRIPTATSPERRTLIGISHLSD